MQKRSVFQLCHPATFGPDPKTSLAPPAQRSDMGVSKFGNGLLVENCEMNPVESRQALLGSDPQIAIARLRNRLDRALRQAIFGLPRARYKGRGNISRRSSGEKGAKKKNQRKNRNVSPGKSRAGEVHAGSLTGPDRVFQANS